MATTSKHAFARHEQRRLLVPGADALAVTLVRVGGDAVVGKNVIENQRWIVYAALIDGNGFGPSLAQLVSRPSKRHQHRRH